MPGGQGVQNAARVAQARDARAVEQVRVDARHLRGDVRAHPQQPARQLIDQLEGLQVQIVAGAGEQRLQILEQRRHHQLVAVRLEQIEHAPAQRFDLAGPAPAGCPRCTRGGASGAWSDDARLARRESCSRLADAHQQQQQQARPACRSGR